MRCTFPSSHINRLPGKDSDFRFLVVEVGIGFIKDLPFMALHVNGPYEEILGFVAAAVDVIILDVGEPISDLDSSFPDSCKEIEKVQWMISIRDTVDYDNQMISGTETVLMDKIQGILYDLIGDVPQKSMRRTNFVELCNGQNTFKKGFQASQPFAALEEAFRDKVHFEIINKCKNLQSTYESEAIMFFKQLKLADAEKTMMQKECQKKRDLRLELVGKSLENPLLRIFYRIVSQPDIRTRMISLLWFQRALSHKMEMTNKGKQFSSMIHLWRELCHIFVSFPSSQGLLPKLAAQHLMDGYPLEILDGDASMFCDLWVTSVLKELQTLTKKALNGKDARIFVLSAMGVQSSGKSTLLNLMFRAQLMTSVGRCTRGVFIQLVPSTRTDYFDYVLIVDTEGLRSPDFPVGEVHDNRLATFGLLSSDASIFMVSNEDDRGLQEVLPMVLLGFKGSAMAEKSGGRIKTKMFFVYRSVDMNDRGNMNHHKEMLKNHLKKAAEEVSNIGRNTPSGNEMQANAFGRGSSELEKLLFDDLHIDNDDEKSGVRCMGNLKKGSRPPEDVPDWEYGKEVSKLREYIHHRIVADPWWTPTTIQKWGDNLSRVWDCICKADFELNFRTAVQCSAYRELQQNLIEGPRREVSEAYLEAFTQLEKTLRAQKDGALRHEDDHDGGKEEDSLNAWYKILEVNVATPVLEQTKIVEELLSNRRWSIWKMEELKNWSSFLTSTAAKFKMRVKDMAQGVLKYEVTALQLEVEMKRNIMKEFRDVNHRKMDKDSREKAFNDMFNAIMDSAQTKFRPQASRVPTNVTQAYRRTGVEQEFTTGISLGSRIFSQVANTWLGPQSNKLEDVTHNLDHSLEVGLRDCTQYSDAIVEAIITSTNKILKNRNLTQDLQVDGHRYVREKLTRKLTEIQGKWDAQHNIAEKLRGADRRLFEFFNSVVNGI